jgi:hypothetical protein
MSIKVLQANSCTNFSNLFSRKQYKTQALQASNIYDAIIKIGNKALHDNFTQFRAARNEIYFARAPRLMMFFLHILFSSLLELNFINNVLHFHVGFEITNTFSPSWEDLGEKAVPGWEAIKEYTFPAPSVTEEGKSRANKSVNNIWRPLRWDKICIQFGSTKKQASGFRLYMIILFLHLYTIWIQLKTPPMQWENMSERI